jgi:hypothetical protein
VSTKLKPTLSFTELDARVNALQFLCGTHQDSESLLDLAAGQLTITAQVLWADVCVDTVSDLLAVPCVEQAQRLVAEKSAPTVLLLYILL